MKHLLLAAAALTTTTHAVVVSTAQTYTVLVGLELSTMGYSAMSYFPSSVDIHVGDSVVFVQNANEVHTVTFLGGKPAPPLLIPVPGNPKEMMFSPEVAYPVIPKPFTGVEYANSGVMSNSEPGSPRNFTLTFPKEGTFNYTCIVHGAIQTGFINVKPTTDKIASPAQVSKSVKKQLVATTKKLRAVGVKAVKLYQSKPVKNADGNHTYTINLGYSSGSFDLMAFFPNKLKAKVGDVLKFVLPDTNDAPHTITFLNGAPDIPLVVVQKPIAKSPPGTLPYLVLNPAAVMPYQMAGPLTSKGIYSSGFLSQSAPAAAREWSIKLAEKGTFEYQCNLHDASGMHGELTVV